MYEIFRLAQDLLPLFGQLWFLTTGPLAGITMTRRQDVIGYLHRHEELKIVNAYLCFLSRCTSPLAVITVVGFLDFRWVSSSAELDHWHTVVNILVFRKLCLTTALQAYPGGCVLSRKMQVVDVRLFVSHVLALLH